MELDRWTPGGGAYTLAGCLREFTPTTRVVEITHHCGVTGVSMLPSRTSSVYMRIVIGPASLWIVFMNVEF